MPPIAVYALIAVAIYLAGFGSGYKVESWHRDSMEKVAVEAADKAITKKSIEANVIASATEKKKEAIRVEYRTITKTVDRIVDRPVYQRECIDDDGLLAINAALTGIATAGRQPDGTVPASRADDRKDGSGPGARPSVPRLPLP